MPGSARREIVAEGEVGVYHCVARCVRRAFLCGHDSVSGRNFQHRKAWVRQGLERLAGSFAIDVATFAIMDNHLHVIIRQRPDVAKSWTAVDVTRRWRLIFGRQPTSKAERDTLAQRIEIEAMDAKLVTLRRQRLSSMSWFMRCLCEPIARRANQEDGCKGRFWEGRFQSQALLDDAAVLACSAYVDLNAVRARVAKTPEGSINTSVYERIRERQRPSRRTEESRDGWLAPMDGQGHVKKTSHRRASDDVLLALKLDEYLSLLDWSGRQIRHDKRGAIPADLQPILDRLKIQPGMWVEVISNFGRWFKYAAGNSESLAAFARSTGRRWFQGLGHCRAAFR